MSDRIKALTVVLEQDLRQEDVEPLMAAIGQMRNVVDVTGEVADPGFICGNHTSTAGDGRKAPEDRLPGCLSNKVERQYDSGRTTVSPAA